jgi:hypothetical protein
VHAPLYLYTGKKLRINTYGNSFTECHQVSDGETWQEYLAAHLASPFETSEWADLASIRLTSRMIREEKRDHGAEYLIFYIWGDDPIRDPIRSLFRVRWGEIYPTWDAAHPDIFHGNFRSNPEMGLDTGQFVEKEQLLPTKESLYHMTDPKWMVDHLESDIALQLAVFSKCRISDLDRARTMRLAFHLGLAFDWSLSGDAELSSNPASRQPPPTRMQLPAKALLDRYSRWATRYILDKSQCVCGATQETVDGVLVRPIRAMIEMKDQGTRYDQEIVDYLKQRSFNYFDMNEVHLADFKKFNLSWEDYLKRYFIGHYNPTGNHFFAFSIKDKIVQWLDPKPITYQQQDHQSVNFKGYLNGYK